jgi:hypothetical protein
VRIIDFLEPELDEPIDLNEDDLDNTSLYLWLAVTSKINPPHNYWFQTEELA